MNTEKIKTKTEYEENIAVCKRAQFVFTKDDSFALYLDFNFDDYHSTSFYITSYAEVEAIRKIINKNKMGFDRDSLDNNDLKELIGKSARVKTAGIGTRCIFNGFIEE